MRAPAPVSRGFTLLEILVAMAIMVVIGAASSVLFGQSLQNRERVGERATALADLQRGFLFMQRDFEEAVARGARDEMGDEQPALMSTHDGGVELTRVGWLNPLDTRQRGTVQRVAYRLQGGRLYRDYWEHPDRLAGSLPVSTVLLDEVLSFRVQYLYRPEKDGRPSGDFTWYDEWPLVEDKDREAMLRRAPLAVSVEIETRRFGSMRRFFRIVANPWARET